MRRADSKGLDRPWMVLEPIPRGYRGTTVISKHDESFEENGAMEKGWGEPGGEMGATADSFLQR